jgi:hypothetical protein
VSPASAPAAPSAPATATMATPATMAAITAENTLARHLGNPFLVLELPIAADRDELERQGAKLLALLAAGIASATRYPTPFGPRPRTEEAVREALAELRDPRKRALHEIWARGIQSGQSAQSASSGG